jgi:hypothetical protein
MTEEAKIWCSNLMVSSARHYCPIRFDLPPPPLGKDHWLWRYRDGDRVEPGKLPDTLRGGQMGMEPPPDAFTIQDRLVVVRERLKAVLDRFRLGRSHLHPVTIRNPGETQPFDGPFYILNIAEHRPVFVREGSRNVVAGGTGKCIITMGRDRLDIAVRAEPPGDVDLWFDPVLKNVIFVSAPLAAAIRAAEIGSFRLFPCREVG